MRLKAQDSPDLLVRLSASPSIIERITGERPHKSAIYRWAERGLRGVRLCTAFAGGHRRTSETWIREFFDAVTAAAEREVTAPMVTPAQLPRNDRAADISRPRRSSREAEIAKADAELRRDGI
jgi:hypothetical protein